MSDAPLLRDGAVARPRARTTAAARVAKRVLDVVGAALALLVLLPVLAVVVIAIRHETPGPALLRQRRVGAGGRVFEMWKLRTMSTGGEELRAELLAHSRDGNWLDLEDDPRITRLGRVLRHSSVDELPQLWNVLRGDMSLVGPRPLIVEEDACVPPWASARADVRPGMTGVWQVSGRTSIPFEEMLELDRRYVTEWSLWRDLAILVRTIPAVLTGRGAN
jgi:lipopolysaccharide/colanic/teichoic acid biosynthesis glycosyltransferase